MTDPMYNPSGRWQRWRTHAVVLLIAGFVWFPLAEMLPLMAARKVLGQPPAVVKALVEVGISLWLVGAWKLYRRYGERSPDTQMPLDRALPEWGGGLAFGFLLFSVMTGVVALLGGFSVQGVRGMGDLWPMLGMAALSGMGGRSCFAG